MLRTFNIYSLFKNSKTIIKEVSKMDIRKLVKSGAASHTISLPIDWITKNKLKKGDTLYLEETNNELKISAQNNQQKQNTKEISIEVDNKEISTIRRQTIS